MDTRQSVEFAREFLSNIVAFFGENLEVTAETEEDTILLTIESSDLNSLLIGRNAETLRGLQYIVSTALRNRDAALIRVSLDVADYKKQHEEKVAEKALGWIEEVRATGDSHVGYLNAADRRVVHRVAAEYEDIRTYSEGEGHDRRIIIAQAGS
ncbi:MAG: R3H domain-containing nucleic acid-binding protein [Candidatus Saccharimonas sp.]